MEKKKAFKNWRPGAFHITFSNGNWLSSTFAPGSYSDNHQAQFPLNNEFVEMESNQIEIMVECPEKLHKKIWKKYGKYGGDEGNSVIGYLNVTQWAEIVTLLSN